MSTRYNVRIDDKENKTRPRVSIEHLVLKRMKELDEWKSVICYIAPLLYACVLQNSMFWNHDQPQEHAIPCPGQASTPYDPPHVFDVGVGELRVNRLGQTVVVSEVAAPPAALARLGFTLLDVVCNACKDFVHDFIPVPCPMVA